MRFNEFWHKYNQVITSVSIIIFIIFSVVMIIQDRELKEQINENCGWGEENYQCFCEKSEAMEIKNKLENEGLYKINLSLDNATLD